jgi:hypothetical protein
MVVGLALVLVVCVAAFYAIQLDNPFKNSGDRQLQGRSSAPFQSEPRMKVTQGPARPAR